MFSAQARAVEAIEKNPQKYAHYLARETGGLLEPEELQTWRLLHAAPQPYTRERWEDTYNWTVKWGMTRSRRHLREHRRQPRLAITKEEPRKRR